MVSARRRPVACGVDVGSTNTKVVALDPEGLVVAAVARPTPRDAQGLSVDVCSLLDEIDHMISATCGEEHQVHAICAAGVGEDGVLVNTALRPLSPALTWFDPRRQSVFRALRPHLHDDQTFDAASDSTRAFVGWAWSRAQPMPGEPTTWVALADIASVRWTGRPFLSDTLASRTGAWRSTDRSWAIDRVELTLGSIDLLPAVIPAGEIVGTLVSPALRSAGTCADDAVVVAGGHDHPIGGWGVDQLVPGAILDSMGTAEVAVAQTSRPGTARRNSVDVAPGIRSAGSTLLRVEELNRNIAWAARDPAVALRIQELLAGSVAPLPVLESGFFVPGQRGGGRPAYAPDAPSDPRVRASAVLGALAVVGRDAVCALQRHGLAGSEVRLAGGWSRYPGWLEIKAMVNDFPTLAIAEPEVTAVGAALLAATARGWAPDPAKALAGPSAAMTAEGRAP